MAPVFHTAAPKCVRIRCLAGARHVSPVSYTHLRAHETRHDLVCRLLLEKKKSWADLWPRSASEKLSQMLIRSGDIPSPRQMSIDKTNYCAMKSERGARCVPCAVCHALVRGSDPPSGHSVHKTTGDTWRAPARHLIRTHLGAAVWKTGAKILDSSPMAKNRAFFQVWEKSVGRRGQPLASWTTDPPDIFVVVIYIHCLSLIHI